MATTESGTRPSVLHLLAPAPVGGLESVVGMLAGGQLRRGGDVAVGAIVEPGPDEHPFVARLEEAGVPVEPLVVPHRSYLREARSVRDLLHRSGPDVVHTHGYRADVLAGTIARLGGWSTVSTVHGFTGGGGKNRLYEWLQRLSLRRHDVVVAVSRAMVGGLEAAGVEHDRIHVIPNAWRSSSGVLDRPAARKRLALPRDAYVVGWVGRLSREKGGDVFLRALARLGDDDLVASVIGDGREREALARLSRDLGVASRVCFHGTVPHAASVYRAFDAFALTSRTEGTPIALFEAIQAGVPVVAARVGGVPDVVSGDEAELVPPEDPGALARSLRSLREDPAAAGERARRARTRLEEDFALEPWLERYDSVYRAALDRREATA